MSHTCSRIWFVFLRRAQGAEAMKVRTSNDPPVPPGEAMKMLRAGARVDTFVREPSVSWRYF